VTSVTKKGGKVLGIPINVLVGDISFFILFEVNKTWSVLSRLDSNK